jgi:hypothetical protein
VKCHLALRSAGQPGRAVAAAAQLMNHMVRNPTHPSPSVVGEYLVVRRRSVG